VSLSSYPEFTTVIFIAHHFTTTKFSAAQIVPLPLPPVRETSMPRRTTSLPFVPQVRKPPMPLRASSLPSASSTESSPASISGFAARTSSVHPVLALRCKWRTACAAALQTDTPEESFLSVMKCRGVTLPAPVKTDFVRPPSTASASRRKRAAHLLAEQAPPIARAASLNDAPHPPLDFATSPAATRRRSSDPDLRLCTAGRTERNTLMRLSPPKLIARASPPVKYDSVRLSLDELSPAAAGSRRRAYSASTNAWRTELHILMRLSPPNSTNKAEGASRLPGALRCAKAHAPLSAVDLVEHSHGSLRPSRLPPPWFDGVAGARASDGQ